jgi:hypothetical protein
MEFKQRHMIKRFQCCGCTCGSNPDDGCLKFEEIGNGWFRCGAHSAGTIIAGVGKIALGLPKGFNKVGALGNSLDIDGISTNIRLKLDAEKEHYNRFNIPVWAIEEKGYLFVRCYCPRINRGYIDIIRGKTIEEICPDAKNVRDFYDDIE